ncbi:hypothetical protein BSPA111_05770 [Buttiauxella sp. A111]|nr:hypothetical protein BSPA111_05770 [Buttiauxella sp. A111]
MWVALALLWPLMTQAERTVASDIALPAQVAVPQMTQTEQGAVPEMSPEQEEVAAPEISQAEDVSVPELSPSGQVAVPDLRQRVTDTTGTLSAEASAALTQSLAQYEQSTGHQLAVLMVESTGEETIEQYATRVFESWKLGDKKRDDGLLLIVAKADHTLRIEVGYGLEGTVTDLQASQVINRDIVPYFKRDDYAGGIESGVDSLIQMSTDPAFAASYADVGETSDSTESGVDSIGAWLFGGFMLMPIVPALFFRKFSPFKRSLFSSLMVAAAVLVISRDVVMAGIAFLVCLVLYIGMTRGGRSGGGRGGGSSGSGRSGSGFSRRGGSGGGFSGGGGSSGGGGASGRW